MKDLFNNEIPEDVAQQISSHGFPLQVEALSLQIDGSLPNVHAQCLAVVLDGLNVVVHHKTGKYTIQLRSLSFEK